ncbi:MAG: ribosome recycling factor [Phycisphaerales bacterium]
MDPDMILLECEEHMSKALDYLKSELRGVRTGRASTGLVEHVRIEAYGSTSELRNLASISTPEPTQIVVKPYDPGTIGAIVKGIEAADLGLNPHSDGKVIRVPIPPLSGERRKQLVSQVKGMGEQAKVAIRNARRDANKHLDQLDKDKDAHISEDEIKRRKDQVQDLTKKHESEIDHLVEAKSAEVTEI